MWKLAIKLLRRREMTSRTLRLLFARRHGITVGMYSYGCFDISRIPQSTIIGRYCSFANTSVILNGNHGIDFLSTHPFLYNIKFGFVDKETIRRTACVIGDDVWIGHNAIILPSVKRIGRGAVIGAGAVVTKDVAAYSIVAGNPARLIRYRFDEKTIKAIETSCWWERDVDWVRKMVKSSPKILFCPVNYFYEMNTLTSAEQ